METMESINVPPGFRFHPTEEELVGYYLNRKVNSLQIDLNVIVDIDLYRIEPWDIQGQGNTSPEAKPKLAMVDFGRLFGKVMILSRRIIGMRKTLVYYRGRAPNGRKEEGWVVCRAFKKPSPSCHPKQHYYSQADYWSNNNNMNSLNYYTNYRLQPSSSSTTAPDLSSPCSSMQTINAIDHQTIESNSNFQEQAYNNNNNFDQSYSLLELPQLDEHHTIGDYDDDRLMNSQNQGISHLLGCFSDDL
ncbi:hypothetical protein Leryth_017793 [Lithospermum erythrorhizon]|nr:hypothetical protein Leryth_017793 [Lithospermum erythrorhizon]